MKFLRRLWLGLFRREQLDADFDAELRSYLDHDIDRRIRAGADPATARREALAAAGGIEPVKEQVREGRAAHALDTLVRDVRFGARLLFKHRVFTSAAIFLLALGIGANTAVFSVVNAVLIRSLPYPDAGRLVVLYEQRPLENNLRNVVSVPDFLDWREQSRSFRAMSAVVHDTMTWQSPSGAEQIMTGIVSPEFFAVLGVKPELGRGFRPEADQQNAVILTHGFWQRRFSGDPSVVGQSITLNGSALEIAGVLPAGFEYPVPDVELFKTLFFRTREGLDRSSHVLQVAARLKPGVTLAAAQAEMHGIAARLEQQYPGDNKGHGVNVVPMRDVLLGPMERPLLMLQGAVALVLLIACANFANLLLARTLAREREFDIRLAIGAGRTRLLRQLLIESTLLALLGGTAGIAVAYVALPLLRALVPPEAPLLGVRTAEVDVSVLGACLAVSLACGLIFGLAPAWRGARGTIPQRPRRRDVFRKVLIATQVAFSVVLLTGAILALRSFAALRSVAPGFDASSVLTAQVAIPFRRYTTAGSVGQYTSQWLDAVRRLPGVSHAGLTSALPLSGADGRRGLAVEGVTPPDPNQPRRAHIRWVTPGYFEAMGMKMVAGRAFRDTDRAGAAPVMIVNQTAARMYFPEGRAVGHRGKPGGTKGPWNEVVGVVADVHHWGLDVEPRPEQYYCHFQAPSWMVNLAVRSAGDPALLTNAIRAELHRLDPQVPFARVMTMEQLMARSIASERSVLSLLSVFAGVALLLTAAGIWATMAYLLSQRRREIGIRLALGATTGAVVRQATGRAMRFALWGIAAGVAFSVVALRLSSVTLFGVNNTDPVTCFVVPAVLLVVAWLANCVPAWRIVRSAGYTALREE
ncbi:MAG: ABC transporter permease [Bryobacterales bacterium]|nr:ABC transporter permease [Bryobacterales bacterium]